MHDSRYAGAFGGEEQHARVLDRVREARGAVVEADPERVVERAHAVETASERGRVVEAVREGLDIRLQRMRAIGMKSQRSHASVRLEQALGDAASRIAEGSGDQID